MFRVENRVGRLVELTIGSPLSEDEVRELAEQELALVRDLGRPFVAVTDLRRAHVFPAAVTDHFITLMRQTSAHLERSALLITDSAVFGLQAERALAESGHAHRRAFRDAVELERWLGEILDPAERERLHAYLAADA